MASLHISSSSGVCSGQFSQLVGLTCYAKKNRNLTLGLCGFSENRESDGSSDVDAGAVVLFTCGHHFTQSTFTNVVLTNTVGEIGAGSSHLAVGKLPSTAALLQQYYTRQGFLPLACPKCVLNALHAQ
ncbi:hypothetical protein BaRGS_00005144 [Batillaria attramentaria]|uniref:Uncharacterized protein n=1 Tax=Batillaria attramentaria TaxID=370345 RepID=A0ABD0LVT0_9CAEN